MGAPAAENELSLRFALDALPMAVSVFDRDLRLIFASRQYQALLDFPTSLCAPGTSIEAFFRYNAERGDYGPGAALGRLVAGVAHELNTPLASAVKHRVDEFAAALDRGPLRRSLLDEFVSGMGEASLLIERNAHRAAALISDFKELASDQASMRRRVFRLQHTVAGLFAALAPTLRKRGVTVSLDIPEEIELDSYPGPLEQVFENLVSNALLHAFGPGAGGTLRIAARLASPAPAGGDVVLVEVGDDGAGMSEAVARQVFDPIFTTRLGTGGTGLGPYIAYSVVTGILGGEISLHSAVGGGTTFYMRLPSRVPLRKSEEQAAL